MKEILLDKMFVHKIQVDGMVQLYEKRYSIKDQKITNTERKKMLLDEQYDADEILKEPSEQFEEDLSSEEEVTPELDFGGSISFNEMDVPPEEDL